MLLLSCERGQAVTIGCYGITVTVLEVRGDRVRLAVSAPAGFTVHSQEVWQQCRLADLPHDGEPSPAA